MPLVQQDRGLFALEKHQVHLPCQCLFTDQKSYYPLYCNEDIKLSLYMSCSEYFTANSFVMTVGHAWWQALWHLAFDSCAILLYCLM